MQSRSIRNLLLVTILIGLAVGCASRDPGHDRKAPTATIDINAEQPWRPVEAAISQAALGNSGGKCEWEAWGWYHQDWYGWAFCQAGPEVDAEAASLAMVIHTAGDGSVKSIETLEGGNAFNDDGLWTVPPAIQERLIVNEDDIYTAAEWLADRWAHPRLAPAIFARYGKALPRTGTQATPAITASTAGQVDVLKILGQGRINEIGYLPDGQIFVNGDRGLGLLDLEDGRISYQYQNILSGRQGFLSADGTTLAVISGQFVEVYETSTLSNRVNIDTGEIPGNIDRVQFLSDGLTLLVQKTISSEGPASVTVALFDLSEGTLIREWQGTGSDVVLSPDGLYVAGLYANTSVYVWSVVRGEVWQKLPGYASAAAFSSDGQILATVEMSEVKIYWVWDGFEIGRCENNVGSISGVALSPDGKLMLTWSNARYPARLWRVPECVQLAILPIHGVTAAAFDQDGSEIILAGDTGIGRYDVASGEFVDIPIDAFNSVSDLSFAPDGMINAGHRLAVSYQPSTSHSVIVNWDVKSGKPLFVTSYYSAPILEYAIESIGIVLGGPGRVQVIDPLDGSLKKEYEGLPRQVQAMVIHGDDQLAISTKNEVRIYSLRAQADKVGPSASISNGWLSSLDWACYLIASLDDGSIKILEEVGEDIQKGWITIPSYKTNYLAVLPDCSIIFGAYSTEIFRWQVGSWASLHYWSMEERITSMSLSPDGSVLAVGLADGSINLLDSSDGSVLVILQEHTGSVTALDFSPDGAYLASGGMDGVVVIWGVK